MKKLMLLAIALFLGMGLFAQVKFPPNKVIVIIKGEKNPTFDESQFPNCTFYYTPTIKVTTEEVKEGGALSATRAIKKKAGLNTTITKAVYSGEPKEVTTLQDQYYFDSNGTLVGRGRHTNNFGNINIEPRSKIKSGVEQADYNTLSKEYVKKGNTKKQAKKYPKDFEGIFYVGKEMNKDFEVQDMEGNKYSIKELVKGNPLTILTTVDILPEYDYNLIKTNVMSEDTGAREEIDAINDLKYVIHYFNSITAIENYMFGQKPYNLNANFDR